MYSGDDSCPQPHDPVFFLELLKRKQRNPVLTAPDYSVDFFFIRLSSCGRNETEAPSGMYRNSLLGRCACFPGEPRSAQHLTSDALSLFQRNFNDECLLASATDYL